MGKQKWMAFRMRRMAIRRAVNDPPIYIHVCTYTLYVHVPNILAHLVYNVFIGIQYKATS